MGELGLLLGRSGTGKTYRAVSILKEYLRKKEEQKVLLLVSSKTHRNRIKDMVLEEIPCYYSLPLYTFNGFSAEVIKRNGRTVRTVSDIYRQILLEKIVDENVLEYYEEVKTFPGFTSALISFIEELKQGLVKPDEFLESYKLLCSKLQSSPSGKFVLRHETPQQDCGVFRSQNKKIKDIMPSEFKAKYDDLFFLCNAYQNDLKKFSLKDNADLAAEAVELIAGNPAVFPEVEELIIDGFYEFTPVQWKIIKLLKSFISKTTVTFSFDEKKPLLFQAQMETLKKLIEMKPSSIDKLDKNFRTKCKDLLEVESLLFSGAGRITESCESIKILQAPGEYLEVEMIAREIVKLVQSGNYSFSDIAVIFRDAGSYPARIRDIFARFSIPYHILHPEPLVSSSLARSLIALMNLFDEGWRREDVFTLLHSPVLGVDPDLAGRIEIEARICGIFSERREWLRDWNSSVDVDKREFFERLDNLEKRFRGVKNIEEFRRLVMEIALNEEAVAKAVKKNQEEFLSALRRIKTLLDEMLKLEGRYRAYSGYEKISLLFKRILLSTNFYSTRLPGEGVKVLGIFDARQQEFPVVFMAGLLERNFPQPPSEDPFIKDRERKIFNDESWICFPEMGRKILEERFLFYTGVTSAKEKLFLSFPYIDADGVDQLPSFYLQELEELLPADFYVTHRKVSDILPEKEDFVLKKDLIDVCPYFLFRSRDRREEKPNPDGAYLYNVLLNDEKILEPLGDTHPVGEEKKQSPHPCGERESAPLGKGFQQVFPRPCGERDRVRGRVSAILPFSISDLLKTQWMPVCTDISDPEILKIIKENIPFSLTDLEAYGRCPGMFFIEGLLKIQPIPEEFTPPDRGTALHRIIADFFKELKKSKDIVKLSSFNKNDLYRIMDTVEDKYLSKLTVNGLRPSLWEIEKRRIKKILKLFLQRELIRDREVFLHPWLFEESFKRFTLGYSEEKSIDIKGRIDRIDIDDSKKLALVMDYKTTRVPSFQEIKDGIALQVPVEMLYVREVLGIMPVAGEYYSISKGGSQGLCFDKYKRSLGSLGNKQSVFSPEDMELILQKSAEACIRYAEGILGGKICAEPSKCYEACRYPDICRMNQ